MRMADQRSMPASSETRSWRTSICTFARPCRAAWAGIVYPCREVPLYGSLSPT